MSRVSTDSVLDVHVYYLHDPRLNPTNHSHSFDVYEDSGDDDDPSSPVSDSSDALMNEMWSCGPSLYVHDDVLNISITGSMTVKQLKDEVYLLSDYWPIHSADCDLLLYHDQRLLYEHQVLGATSWFRKACERMDSVKIQVGEAAPACGIWLLAVPIDSCACPHCSAYQSKRSHRRVKLAQRHIEEHYQTEYVTTTIQPSPAGSAERAHFDEDDSWMDEPGNAKNSEKASKVKKSKKKTKASSAKGKPSNESSNGASKSSPSTPVIKARVGQQTFVQPSLLAPSIQSLKQPVKPLFSKQASTDPDFTVVLSKKEKKAKAKLDEVDPHKPSKPLKPKSSPYQQPASSSHMNVTPVSNKRKPVTPVFKPAAAAMSPKLAAPSMSTIHLSPRLMSREPPASRSVKHTRAKPNTPLISASIAPQSSRASSTDSGSHSAHSIDSTGSPCRSSSIDETDRHSMSSITFSPSSVASTQSIHSQSSGESQGFSLYTSSNGKWSPLIAPVNPVPSGKSSPVIQPISSMESVRTFGDPMPFSPILHGYVAPVQRPIPVGPASLLSSSAVLNRTISSVDDDHDFGGAMSAADVSKLCDDEVDHPVRVPAPARPTPRFVHPQFSLQRAVPAPLASTAPTVTAASTAPFESGASVQKLNYALYHPLPQVHFSSPYAYGAAPTFMRPGVTTSAYPTTGSQWQ